MTRYVKPYLFLLVACHMAQGVESQSAATQWIPPDALLCIELTEPTALIDMLTSDRAFNALKKLPVYQNRETNPGFTEFLNGIRFLETALAMPWREALPQLIGGGVTFAVCPDESVILIVDAEDGQLLQRLHEIALGLAKVEAGQKGQSGPVSAEYLGVTGWTFDNKEAHAIIDNRLILTNKPDTLKAVLESRERASAGLNTCPKYLAAGKTVAEGDVGRIYADLETLTQIPDLSKALAEGTSNPIAALLFAGILESIRNSTWLSVGLHAHEDTLKLQAHVDGRMLDRKSAAGFVLPRQLGQGAWPHLSVPGGIASLSLYRDLFRFYGAKDDLFPERTSGLIFFENMMGIFFSGRDLTDEVLAETLPELRLVVAQQQYDPAQGVPSVQFPGFALVMRLKEELAFDMVAEEAWQKAVGLVNFTRGQQGMPGLIIDRPMHNKTKFTVGYFSMAGADDSAHLHTRFNFRPALALPHNYLILSSTDALARDLIDAVNREKNGSAQTDTSDHTSVELNGQSLSAILRANIKALVRNNMVDKGVSEQEAKTSMNTLITVAQLIDRIKLSLGTHQSLTRAGLELGLKLSE